MLANRISELARTGEWLAGWARDQALAKDVTFAIRLCLEEALANIVLHGVPDGDHLIELAICRTEDGVVVTITDDGRPFDPLTAPQPSHSRDLTMAIPGGYGVILLKSYADSLTYERSAGRNHLSLAFSVRGETSTQGR